ncbi:hypothetical protein [Mucilaginibacter paludis]|uniref:Uncharacterized protein n=1 Tax=Mucilaginibacter paludis DSM 18603 TaxID=714943 RepID=H1Y533_9SPHI|nr:hypothetical protein [Mucilaginibacter paludis]EHQ28576.1 hypothetical protein Mucpa_4486 [Mucilaginibacter paludis DSM 18603]
MNQGSAQQTSIIIASVKEVVISVVIQILGIQILLLALPVHTGDKRFNQ